MIVLDTNVVAEIMKPDPDPAVRVWMNFQVAETMYLSSVTLAENLFAIGAMPASKRKNKLAQAYEGLIGMFKDRVLAFDFAAARHYAVLAVAAQSIERGFPIPNGCIVVRKWS